MACTSSSVTPLSGNYCHHHHHIIVISMGTIWPRRERRKRRRGRTGGVREELSTRYVTTREPSTTPLSKPLGVKPQMQNNRFNNLEEGSLPWMTAVPMDKAVRNEQRPRTTFVPPQMSILFSCLVIPSRTRCPALHLPPPPRAPPSYLNDAPPRPPHSRGHVLVRFIIQAEGRRRFDSVDVSQKRSPLRLLLNRHLGLDIRKRESRL